MHKFRTVTLEGAAAAQAWDAYLRNRTHFPKLEREYAGKLSAPDVALFALPPHAADFMTSAHTEAIAIGDKAAAVLALEAMQLHNFDILYVHTRTTLRSKGFAKMLVEQCEDVVAGQMLFATVHAWDECRFFLRNGFQVAESRFSSFRAQDAGVFLWRRARSAGG